jgi:hypothetical protein
MACGAASPRTLAFSVARLTLASSTPGTAFRAFSTRATQDAQLMPSMSKPRLDCACMNSPVRWGQHIPSHDGKVKCNPIGIDTGPLNTSNTAPAFALAR